MSLVSKYTCNGRIKITLCLLNKTYISKEISASIVESNEKMRSRDVSKVARGEQAPRPPQESPQVSRAPPPSSTDPKVQSGPKKENASNQARRCYDTYYEYHMCIQEKGNEAQECKRVADYYKTMCPEWTGRWSIE